MGLLSACVATVPRRLAAIAFALLGVGAVAFAIHARDHRSVRCATEPIAANAPASASPEPLLVEPPGGPILWGITTAQTTIRLDGRRYVVEHVRGQGMTVRFAASMGCAADLEVTRLAPAPRLVTRRPMTAPMVMAYVPDGRYELTLVCEHDRGATTQLVLSARTPG